MTHCINCNGGGLVGQGAEPWLKIGRIETCALCSGTGVKPEEAQHTEPEVQVSEPAATEDEQAPVDNQLEPEPTEKVPGEVEEPKGFFGKVVDAVLG